MAFRRYKRRRTGKRRFRRGGRRSFRRGGRKYVHNRTAWGPVGIRKGRIPKAPPRQDVDDGRWRPWAVAKVATSLGIAYGAAKLLIQRDFLTKLSQTWQIGKQVGPIVKALVSGVRDPEQRQEMRKGIAQLWKNRDGVFGKGLSLDKARKTWKKPLWMLRDPHEGVVVQEDPSFLEGKARLNAQRGDDVYSYKALAGPKKQKGWNPWDIGSFEGIHLGPQEQASAIAHYNYQREHGDFTGIQGMLDDPIVGPRLRQAVWNDSKGGSIKSKPIDLARDPGDL